MPDFRSCFAFEGCDLGKLGSLETALLSRCWGQERIRMVHRGDGTVNLYLTCEIGCECARALKEHAAKGTP